MAISAEKKKEYNARYYAAHKPEMAVYRKKWATENKEKVAATKARWIANNPEKAMASSKRRCARWRAKNAEKLAARRLSRKEMDRQREKQARYRKKYPERVKAYYIANKNDWRLRQAKYRATKARATPPWASTTAIEAIYEAAVAKSESTGESWHVDHIVPLHSNLVCGLHVANNLQIVPALINFRKNNKVWPDMPERSTA